MAGNFDIPEVTVYFNNKLLRGNRSTKLDNSALDAFESPNMAPIAHVEITIKVNYESIFRSPSLAPFVVHDRLCRNVGLLRIFPSISIDSVRGFLRAPTQGVVLQTFGAGNMPSRRTDIIDEIKDAVDRGCIVVNCSQCVRGQVDVHYFTGKVSLRIFFFVYRALTIKSTITFIYFRIYCSCFSTLKLIFIVKVKLF
ncbi:unnamed protein product [Toxocara canis]|uniref:asparaginase n=1 Tax=Toxocara canis TaxID=6265 RepID=A0A183U6R9_TOXCA|nr:unnamed protein product [Toxocara canis]